MHRRQNGFTLIEIAIVLVIIGLLLGGVLKGQELITGARVRNLVAQQDGVKAAYFGFLDRYRALPGDYKANGTIANLGTDCKDGAGVAGNGNADGAIKAGSPSYENILVWEHLSKAGFINGSYTCKTADDSTTNPSNPYGGRLNLEFNSKYGGTATDRHNLNTGGAVPSDILAEVDRKVDDGNPTTGSFRSAWSGSETAVDSACAAAAWVTASPGANCKGASIF